MLDDLSRQALTVLNVSAWSQIGVLVRIYLDLFFTNGCQGAWGVCLLSSGGAHRTFGSYFPDLAANMLGSFVMGVLTSASALKGESTRAVAILPENHAWQDAPELMVGLRTGFCGSLTTFASWELSLVTLLIGGRGIQGGQWAEFLWGLIIGFQLSLSSYMFGAHLAANLDAYLTRPPRSCGSHAIEVEGKKAESVAPKSHKGGAVSQGQSKGTDGSSAREERHALSEGPEADTAGWDLEERGQLQGSGAGADGWGAEEQGRDAPKKEPAPQSIKETGPFRKTHVAVLVMLTLLTSLWIVLAIVDSKASHAQRRRQWFALLFAPFGALLRWKLALLNSSVPSLKWLPLGTLAANLIACCIDFGLQAGLQRITVPGYWVTLLFKAVQTGFSGALSTVSTFVAEVHSMPGEKADNIHGYIYGFVSISLGALSGLVIYGWSVWA